MTNEEIKTRLEGLERKLNKMENLEERLEKSFRNVEKFRDKMIQNGYSYAMLEEFNKAIQPIMQHVNEIRNARAKEKALQDALAAKQRDEERWKAERKEAIARQLQPVEFPYNHKCRNFTFSDGEAQCDVKMDLQFCNANCPYATTAPCSNKVDARGRTVVYRKRTYYGGK